MSSRSRAEQVDNPSDVSDLLRHDLEYEPLIRRASTGRLHLEREERRIGNLLNQGGWGARCGSAAGFVRPLAWDSAHFGVVCADLARVYAPLEAHYDVRSLLRRLISDAQERSVDLLSVRLRGDQHHALTALLGAGFQLVDHSIEIGGPLVPRPAQVVPQPVQAAPQSDRAPDLGVLILRDPEPNDSAKLASIATTFTSNRFHRDPRVAPGKARGVYESWARNAVDGTHGNVVVAQIGGAAAGFSTYRPPDDALNVGSIGLLIVAPEFRGHRLLGALVAECGRRMPAARAIATSTQSTNISALRAFSRSGLLPFQTRYVLHGWLDPAHQAVDILTLQ